MVDPDELRRLTEVFREHEADDPEAWARSQLEEGIPQLAIFCFSKALWEGVVEEGGPVVLGPAVHQAMYQFDDAAIGNLFNKEGLPVAPFRTDDWNDFKYSPLAPGVIAPTFTADSLPPGSN